MDMVRESALGQLIRWATKNQSFKYLEEQPGTSILENSLAEKQAIALHSLNESTRADQERSGESTIRDFECVGDDQRQTLHEPPQKDDKDVLLVGWYSKSDPENPQNWSSKKKAFVQVQLMLYTFVVYCGSAIYVPSEEPLGKLWNIGQTKAALGLSLYVLGYGVGPLLFSPLSEVPRIGRNIPYITTFAIFVILAVPTALIDNYAGLLVLRFLTGFMGSPCLATGGATVQDMFSFQQIPYQFAVWISAAFCGPALGPLLSGFAVPAINWRISLWEILWMSGPVFLLMFVFFPETSADNILLRRAQRLRTATENNKYQSQSEISQANTTFQSAIYKSLLIPFQINFQDPAVCFINLYSAYVYGVYYSYFEVFPLVYIDIYGFNGGELGIVFVSIIVATVIAMAIYFSWLHWSFHPQVAARGLRFQEQVLVPCLYVVFCLPVGLFIFAWTSRNDIHWIVSIIGMIIANAGNFILSV